MDICRPQGQKKGYPEETDRGSFWRGTAIDVDTRLRVGRSIAKTEDEVAIDLMYQIRDHGNPIDPPAIATDGYDGYPEAMLETWGKVPAYSGGGRPPTRKKPQPNWKCIQVIKRRSGGRIIGITHKVVFGDKKDIYKLMGNHTSYVERTHLTSRQMNGRLVRKTLSFSKEFGMLQASCAWEDSVYNLVRPLKTLRIEVNDSQRKWKKRSPAMAAGMTHHLWTIEELLKTVVAPIPST